VIKVTFEGKDFYDVVEEMEKYLADTMAPQAVDEPEKPAKPAKPEKPEKPEKPKPDVAERMAKARAARGSKKPKQGVPVVHKAVDEPVQIPVQTPVSSLEEFDDFEAPPNEPPPAAEEIFDMTKLAAIRVKTTEELQTAYANGKHKQVLDLLAKYGNGAKSFRELALKDFVPIREAIDGGALA
jgi:hypothetical protein